MDKATDIEMDLFFTLLPKVWETYKEEKYNANEELANAMADDDQDKVEEIISDIKQEFLDTFYTYMED